MPQIRSELAKLFFKEVAKESENLVSNKHASVLKKISALDIKNLSLKEVCVELKERCPLLFSVIVTCAVPRERKESPEWLPSVAVAAAVLMKQRSRMMNSVQIMLMTLIKYTGFQVCVCL